MTAIITQSRLYLVDAGVMFADNRKLGVSSLFNDISPLVKQFGEPAAYIITHGHEDHIGALPYMLQKWPAPVYIPSWAKALAELRLERLGLSLQLSGYFRKVKEGDLISIGDESFEYIRVNHSIPDANAVCIKTKTHTIVHSGDFKVDLKSSEQKPIDLNRLKKLGSMGVDLFICDSTNASKPGIGPGENTTLEPLKRAFASCPGRIFITTFSSNLWRLINIISAARELGKQVCIAGAGLQNSLNIAKDEGIYSPKHGSVIELKELKNFDPNNMVIVVSGSQGEFRSALQRIVNGEHRQLKIQENDSVIFSSRIIPGNEKDVAYLTSKIRLQGGRIITPSQSPGIHVSGHAYGGEIEIMLDALKPNTFMPVHGTFNQIIDNADNQGMNYNTVICENSSGIYLNGAKADPFQIEDLDNLYIDDTGKLLNHETMRERLRIGESGAIFVSGVFDKKKKKFLQGPSIQTFGLLNEKNSNDELSLSKPIAAELNSIIQTAKTKHDSDKLNESIRIYVRRHATIEFDKKPTVVSKIWFV